MKLVKVTYDSGIPLIGSIAFGIIDRGTDLIQVRPTSICNHRCLYCSTNSNNPDMHPANFMVECNYLLDYVNEVAKYKSVPIECNLDSVGEVMTYPDIVNLVKGLCSNPLVKRISMQSNGSLLTPNMIKKLEKAGLNQINLSINTLDEELAKKLSGIEHYNLKKILNIAEKISKSNIELLLAPVWIPKVNEMEELITLAKELNAKIGIQKYEVYKYSRKIKTKPLTYWKFYDQLKKWEKEFNYKLILTRQDMGIKKCKSLPLKFKKNEVVKLEVKAPGWWRNQMHAVGRNRVVSVNGCKASPGDLVNVKIVETKNNIYVGNLF
ncbi:radical SAM protein [Candidatus Woesearchaeota archaeon]|nr:MAG: radical SAM protein [Candidatus Woesearchaeota archaeon]